MRGAAYFERGGSICGLKRRNRYTGRGVIRSARADVADSVDKLRGRNTRLERYLETTVRLGEKVALL